MKRFSLEIASRGLGLIICSCSLLQAQTLVRVGNADTVYGWAYGVNNSGQVVGEASTARPGGGIITRGFLYSGGTTTVLGTMGGDYSVAEGINDAGQVSGQAATSNYNERLAVIYSAGSISSLGALPGDTQSEGRAINNFGQVAGLSSDSHDGKHSFLYSQGTMTDIGSLGGTGGTYALAMNDSAQVVGSSYTNGNASLHAFVYASGIMTDIGATIGLGSSGANGINNAGQIVGGRDLGGAFLYSNGIVTSLGTLGGAQSSAYDINNNGQIVGNSYTSDNVMSAFTYSAGMGMENLNTLYASSLVNGTGPETGFVNLDFANAVNDLGQIAGMGEWWDGTSISSQGYLLTPMAVPEPQPIWALSLVLLLGFIRKNSWLGNKLQVFRAQARS